MIRSRRRAHARAAPVLAAALALLLVAGLAWRPELPPISSEELRLLRQAGFAEPAAPGAESVERVDGALTFELEVEEAGDGALRLALRPHRPILRPDLLVYWVPTLGAERPGDEAVLLGSLAGASRRRLLLPAELRREGGELLVYSLPHHSAVAHLPLPGRGVSER